MGHRKRVTRPESVIQHPNSGCGHIDGGRSMVRTQWLMGTQSRQLSDEEMQQFVEGYFSVRKPSGDESSALPLIFAAYYAKRLCELHRKWGPTSPNRKTWELEDRILALPDTAIRMGQAAIDGID
jgi:hypothetical protein